MISLLGPNLFECAQIPFTVVMSDGWVATFQSSVYSKVQLPFMDGLRSTVAASNSIMPKSESLFVSLLGLIRTNVRVQCLSLMFRIFL